MDTLLIPIRDRLIREEYNGYNVYELCKKWDLGESMVRTIIRDKIRELRQAPIDGQVSLFDAPEIETITIFCCIFVVDGCCKDKV